VPLSVVRSAFARRTSVHAAIRRLGAARLISSAGNDATGVAIGFSLYEQTHSAHWLSLSLMLTIGASALLSPLGGWAGDRFDRRKLMISAELAACGLFATLALVHTPAVLLAIGFLSTVIGTVFGPASGAAIAHIAGERHLTWANSVIATGANVGRAAGRFGSGVVIATFGAGSVFLLDAMTFVVSAALVASVGLAFSAAREETPAVEATVNGKREGGMRFLRSHRVLRLVTASACISTFATAFSMTAEVPLVFELGAGAVGLGALTACWTAGMVAGSWYAGRALHSGNEATGVFAGRLALAAGVGLVGVSPSLSPMLACYLLGGMGGGFMGVAAQSLVMRNTPDRLRARTQGAMECCRNFAFGLGVIGAGALVGIAGARPVYAMVGLVMAVGTLPVATLVFRLGGPRSLLPATWRRNADSSPAPTPAPVLGGTQWHAAGVRIPGFDGRALAPAT
jgi:MFS family permease